MRRTPSKDAAPRRMAPKVDGSGAAVTETLSMPMWALFPEPAPVVHVQRKSAVPATAKESPEMGGKRIWQLLRQPINIHAILNGGIPVEIVRIGDGPEVEIRFDPGRHTPAKQFAGE